MFKKLGALLLILIIVSVSSIGAYAGPTDGISGTTTQPAIYSSFRQSGNSTESAFTTNGAFTTKSAFTANSAIAGESAAALLKNDFEFVFENTLKNGSAVNSGLLIMTITSPDKDKDSTYKKSYILSGNSEFNDVVITIAKYNEGTGKYELMYNTDGESSWDIGNFRLFSKEIILTEGTNKIKIMAHRKSQREEAVLDSIQVNCFTIELLNESIIGKVIKKTKDIGLDLTRGMSNFFDRSKTTATK